MKRKFLKKLTSLALAVLMLATMMPALMLGIGAAESTVTLSFAGGSGTNLDPISFTDAGGASAVFTAGTHSTKPRWDTSCVRFYGTSSVTNKLTVTAPTGSNITKIEFTMNGSYDLAKVSADSGTIDSNTSTWTGNAASVVFTTTAQTRFENVKITYTTADTSCAHTNKVAIGEAKDATCTEDGITAGEKCADCEATLVAQVTLPALRHNYVDGICSRCNGSKPSVSNTSVTYTFKDYPSGTQYAENEEHVLDYYVTMFTTEAYFTTELRLYSSASHDSFAIIQSTELIDSIVLNAGDTVDTLNVYTSTDGTAWSAAQEVAITSTDYSDYTVDLPNDTTYIKLDVKGTNQVRIAYMTVKFTNVAAIGCSHTNTTEVAEVPATCTEAGYTVGVQCTYCTEFVSGHEVIPATGIHTIDANGTCSVCNTKIIYTIPEAIAAANKTKVTVSGTVIDIGTPWSTHGNKISVTIEDADGNKLYIYNLATQVVLGDVITVTGEIGIYNSQKQIDAGATAEITGHEDFADLNGFSLTLNKGVTINTTFTITEGWLAANAGAQVVFKIGNEVIGSSAAIAGENAYSVGLTPLRINDEVTVELQLANGTVVGEAKNVSVAAYKTAVEADATGKLGLSEAKYNALVDLLDAIDAYAKAAEQTGENLTESFEGVEDPSVTDNGDFFGQSSALLEEQASLKFIFGTDLTASTTLSVTLAGKALVTDAADFGNYVSINGLFPTSFNDEIVITLSEGGETAATMTLTFNAYLKALYSDASSSQALKNLAAATYQYGVASEAFVSAS